MLQVLILLLLAFGCELVRPNPTSTKVSYTFAVDDTGSMGNEMKAVRDGIKDLLRIAPEAVANYVVVLFNDPTIGPWIKSNDNADITQFVDALNTHKGGDCPEMAMTGLRKAIELSDRGSFIFFFSDASAKDYHLQAQVTAEANAKDIMILFVLTGCCSGCNTVQFNTYKNVTNDTGGRMYQVSETGAEQFMKYTLLVAARDALLMKSAPTNFSEIVDIGNRGVLPTPLPTTTNNTVKTPLPTTKTNIVTTPLPTTKTNIVPTPLPTPKTNFVTGCAQQTASMTIASLFFVGLFAATGIFL